MHKLAAAKSIILHNFEMFGLMLNKRLSKDFLLGSAQTSLLASRRYAEGVEFAFGFFKRSLKFFYVIIWR